MTFVGFTLPARQALPFQNGCRKQRSRPVHCSTTINKPSVLNWSVRLPKSLRYEVLNEYPPLIRLESILSKSACAALIEHQKSNSAPERANYLNFDSGDGHGFRQGIDPKCAAFTPVDSLLRELFPERTARFSEELWVRPRNHEIVVRDATTVHYHAGEGVGAHVDGKDATLLFYLQEPISGGDTNFCNAQISCPVKQGDALLYESKHALTHYAEKVTEGEKWVMQLLIDYRVRSDDI